jgi:hypothetical protein
MLGMSASLNLTVAVVVAVVLLEVVGVGATAMGVVDEKAVMVRPEALKEEGEALSVVET